MLHFFDPEVAVHYGVEEAVFIQNLRFWIQRNQANEENFREGKYWSYNSRRAMAELFPYWSEKQVRRIIEKLKIAGAIEAGCFNSSKYDRTTWYTLRADLMIKKILPKEEIEAAEEGNIDWPKWANERADMGQSLNTDVNTDVCIGADALTHTEPSRSKKPEDAKKTTLTVEDLVAEGVKEEHARDWIKARGKKTLTPTAWARLKSDAAKHGGTPAQAVKICAENGWQGLNHDGAARAFAELKATQNRPQQWQPEDPNKICVSPTGEKWFMGRRVI